MAGSVHVGSYVVGVGTTGGSFVQFDAAAEKRQARGVSEALDAGPEATPAPVEVVEDFKTSAETVTNRIDHAKRLCEAATQGRLLDRDLVTAEVGALLQLLQRLDKEGRYDEELRLARALHGLLVLTFRWLELVRTLRVALRAARNAHDAVSEAWALHELGTLHLCAGKAKRAAEHFEAALVLQERLGDTIGRCRTRHNLDSARRDVARRATSRRVRRVALGAIVLALLAGTGAGYALDTGADGPADAGALPPATRAATLALDIRGNGSGRVTRGLTIDCPGECVETQEAGTTVRVTATPAEGSRFVRWEDADCEKERQGALTCTVTLRGTTVLGAVFEQLPPPKELKRLEVERRGSGSGRVTRGTAIACPADCDELLEPGTSVTLTATAADGSVFVRWEGVECAEGTRDSVTCTVTVNENTTVVAAFDVREFILTVERTGNANGTVTGGTALNCPDACTERFASGTSVTLQATASEGAEFTGWEGVTCADGSTDEPTCTFTVTDDTTVRAGFEPAPD
jgi:hypothetical protein